MERDRRRRRLPRDTRTVTRQRFYTLADVRLGPRQRSNGERFYIVPPTAEEALMEIVRLRAEADAYRDAVDAGTQLLTVRERLAAGDRSGALVEQRDRATGTDGAPVVDLAARR